MPVTTNDRNTLNLQLKNRLIIIIQPSSKSASNITVRLNFTVLTPLVVLLVTSYHDKVSPGIRLVIKLQKITDCTDSTTGANLTTLYISLPFLTRYVRARQRKMKREPFYFIAN